MSGNLKLFKLIFLIVIIVPTINAFGSISSEISMIWSKVSNQAENAYKKFISTPIKNVFENKEENKNVSINPAKERGHLNFFGRDLVRDIKLTVDKNVNNLLAATSGRFHINNTYLNGIVDEFKKRIKAIFPGTLWCGDGNIAETNITLGLFHLTDNCCREHDSCNDSINSGERRNSIINTGLFTRSNCRCDTKFYNCLKEANSIISHKIGFTYFTVLGPQCFKNDYPIIKCNKMNKGRCIDYKLNLTKNKYEQWFDNPTY